jgi:hypothetical protein
MYRRYADASRPLSNGTLLGVPSGWPNVMGRNRYGWYRSHSTESANDFGFLATTSRVPLMTSAGGPTDTTAAVSVDARVVVVVSVVVVVVVVVVGASSLIDSASSCDGDLTPYGYWIWRRGSVTHQCSPKMTCQMYSSAMAG